MMDSVIVLTPLSVLPILWLLGFVGCSLEAEGSATAPATTATDQKLVTLTWGTVKNDTTSIAFECDVHEVSATGAKSTTSFHGAAVGAAAWPGSYVPSGGQVTALVTIESLLAQTYSIDARCTVKAASAASEIVLKKTTLFAGSADWQFVLVYDSTDGWKLL